jgi:peptidoglycan/LPS O-acetylase OafA/YrhL
VTKKFQLAERASVHLNLIRGVSALAVMLGHVRGLFFVDFPFLANKSFAYRVLYAVTGFGHQAVMIFFVLSGYFIGMSVIDSVRGQRWSWREYLVNRLTRLQLVLFPALILGAIWDQIGMRIPQAASFYYGGLYKYFVPSVALRSTIPVFFGNLFFLQSVVSPVFGSNGPLWSLSYEFWYYILFPALVLAAASWTGIRNRILYVALAALLLWFIGPQISLYFVIWLAGALVGRLYRTVQSVPPRMQVIISMAAGLLFFGVLAWSRTHQFSSGTLTDYLIGFCFALWLYTLIHSSREDVSPTYAYAAKRLSGFSYTLYLTHFPALLLLRGLIDPQGNWQPNLLHLLYGLGIALLMLTYAFVVAEFTEARTAMVRRRLLQPLAHTANGGGMTMAREGSALIRVHLGCGLTTPSGWVNVDGSWNARLAKRPILRRALHALHVTSADKIEVPWNPEILIHDLRTPLPFRDGSASTVYSSHLLEHLYFEEGQRLIRETHRVLAEGGILRIVVPDLGSIVREYLGERPFGEASNGAGRACSADQVNQRLLMRSSAPPSDNFFSRIYNSWMDFHTHKWMYDANSLKHHLESAGFVEVRQMALHESRIDGIEQVENPSRVLKGEGICIEGIKPVHGP